jgi:hypothetical protein
MIHILWCTLRPQVFVNSYKTWISRSTNKNNIKTYSCVNYKEHADFIKKNTPEVDVIITDRPERIGVCYPSYLLSSTLEGNSNDIVVFASDDFLPPKNWDIYLSNKLSNKDGVLMVRDGYQLPDSSNMQYPCITIPIMTYSALEKMNKVIYHPSYSHMYSDSELYLTSKDLGILIDDRMKDDTVFEHFHYAAGKRNADVADQAYNDKWKDDESNWNKRRLLSIEERIKI